MAPHDSTGGVTPFEVFHGAPSRLQFSIMDGNGERVDEDKELQLPALFAEAVAVSTKVFCQLAKTYS